MCDYEKAGVARILLRCNGGSNHPSNLQTLCDSCNCAKAGLVDAKVKKNGTDQINQA